MCTCCFFLGHFFRSRSSALGKKPIVFFLVWMNLSRAWWEGGEQGTSTVWVVLKDVGPPACRGGLSGGSGELTIIWAVFTTNCQASLSAAVQLENWSTRLLNKSPTGCAVLARRSFPLPLRATLQQPPPDRHLNSLPEFIDILSLISGIDSVCIPGDIHCFAPASGFSCSHVEKQWGALTLLQGSFLS